MEYDILQDLIDFKEQATEEEFNQLVNEVNKVIGTAKEQVIKFEVLERRIRRYFDEEATYDYNHIRNDNGTLTIRLTSTLYPDAELFNIVYKEIPLTSTCEIVSFTRTPDYCYSSRESYIDQPKVISLATAQSLIKYADRLEWTMLESILGKPVRVDREKL